MNASSEAGFDENAWITVVAFDPGVTTGWSWFSLPVDRLLAAGEESVGRRLRCGKSDAGEIALVREKEAGRYSGVGSSFVKWDNHSVSEMQGLVRSVWEEVENDPSVDVFVVVIEDFVLRLLDSGRALLAPVRITAGYEFAMKDSGVPVCKFSASEAKRTVSDERLQRWGLYRPGSPHPRDATRHAVLFLRKWASDPRFRSLYGAGLIS